MIGVSLALLCWRESRAGMHGVYSRAGLDWTKLDCVELDCVGLGLVLSCLLL